MKKFQRYFGSLKYSLKLFLPKKLPLFLTIALVTVPAVLVEKNPDIIESHNTFVQNVFWIFQGSLSIQPSVHIGWIFIHILFLFSVCGLPTRKSFHDDSSSFMLTGNRVLWWLVRCLTVWVIVTVDYFVLLASTFGYTISQGKTEWMALTRYDLVILIIPYFAMLTYAFVQTALSTVINPAVSFLVMMIMMFASNEIQSYLLIMNYSILLRNDAFISTGLKMGVIILIMVGLITLSIIIGAFVIRKKDIIGK